MVRGVSDPLKLGFEPKDPGFSVFRSFSDNPEILGKFHRRRKKVGSHKVLLQIFMKICNIAAREWLSPLSGFTVTRENFAVSERDF